MTSKPISGFAGGTKLRGEKEHWMEQSQREDTGGTGSVTATYTEYGVLSSMYGVQSVTQKKDRI